MHVKSLDLLNFRNYRTLSLALDPGINIFYGENAQGKTNILEAVYLAGTSKSHRGTRDRDMIRMGEGEGHIRMHVDKNGNDYRIDMHLRKNKSKGIAIGGIQIKRASELFGIVNIVFFSPEDLNIIKSGPSERRRMADRILCETDRIYLSDLTQYGKCLIQRNRLLHDLFANASLESELPVWDEQLVNYGRRIICKRAEFVQMLEGIAAEIHADLTGGSERLTLAYEPNVAEGEFAEKVARCRGTDLKMKSSTVGPHRDDIGIRVNGMDLRLYGSQGQQRTAAISLKLAEIRIIEERIRNKPVLLLDDVLSELDRGRQNYLLGNIRDIQTLITCTGLDEFVKNRFEADRTFHVVGGRVEA
ncbi:MAG: DNA replication/repair protein RecF [Lachnospiraceae bacterium]|nr:DNA replication/repair protein RecF [Lachnospiraceae bacterium]